MGDSTDMTGHPVVEHPFDADTRVDPTGDGHSRGCCPIAGTRSAGSSTRVEPGPAQRRPDGEVLDEVQGRTRRRHPASLPALVDAAAPVVLELGLAGSMTVQLTTHVRGRPAPGWLACRVATRYVIGGYHEEDFEIWDREGNLVAQARQLGLRRRVTSRARQGAVGHHRQRFTPAAGALARDL